MAVIVSMLRGINVGGNSKIRMDALRALYGSLGLREPQSYIQSGNVLFKTEERALQEVAGRIENAIAANFGIRPAVILRTPDELRDIVARNPFAARSDVSPSKLLVMFLAGDPSREARDRIRQMKTDPEELWIEGRELFIYFPDGMGRSKLPMASIEKTIKTAGTGRNWNSVTKLLELAEMMESAG